MDIGFIGLGMMEQLIAGHLLAAGHDLVVHTRTRAKAEPLLARGARWANAPAEVAAATDLVLTMVGGPDDVAAVYRGETACSPARERARSWSRPLRSAAPGAGGHQHRSPPW